MINSRPAPSAGVPAPAGTTCTARLYDEYCAVPSQVVRTRMRHIHPCAAPYPVLRQVRRATESTYSRYRVYRHVIHTVPTAPAVLDEASSAMPLQVKALQLESYVRVPALYLLDFTASHLHIYTSIPSPLASPLLSFSSPSIILLCSPKSSSYSVVLVLPTPCCWSSRPCKSTLSFSYPC